jgi:hypothetical protein
MKSVRTASHSILSHRSSSRSKQMSRTNRLPSRSAWLVVMRAHRDVTQLACDRVIRLSQCIGGCRVEHVEAADICDVSLEVRRAKDLIPDRVKLIDVNLHTFPCSLVTNNDPGPLLRCPELDEERVDDLRLVDTFRWNRSALAERREELDTLSACGGCGGEQLDEKDGSQATSCHDSAVR